MNLRFLRPENAVVVLCGVGIGYGVWAAAPAIVHKSQPWDAQWPYYSAVLITTGGLVRLRTSADYVALFLGLWFGQNLAIFVLPLDRTDWWGGPVFQALIGMLSTGAGALISLVGYLAGSAIRSRFGRPPVNPPRDGPPAVR